ncbi:MAG: aminoacyl-tRNA hydrolase [Tepidisphaeraceae bacterium]|jgi:PTH1 family peptidyl-tRNA hydrolase
MKIIVGLGNPGREYVSTRHNVGFDVIDALARRFGWISSTDDFQRQARTAFDGLSMNGTVSLQSTGATEKVLLLKPQTYMNVSGKSVQAAAAFYRVPPEELMVVLDDMALPCGRIRIRSSGSAGGHNGLKDIERCLGTIQYPRLRIGIDAPPSFLPWKDYVLQRFTNEQRAMVGPAIERAAAAVHEWMERGITPAMNRFNGDDEPCKTTEKESNNPGGRT